jgi:hypothetical protein
MASTLTVRQSDCEPAFVTVSRKAAATASAALLRFPRKQLWQDNRDKPRTAIGAMGSNASTSPVTWASKRSARPIAASDAARRRFTAVDLNENVFDHSAFLH